MQVVMRMRATDGQIHDVCARVAQAGMRPNRIQGDERVVIACVGEPDGKRDELMEQLRLFDGVKEVKSISSSFKLVSREVHPAVRKFRLNGFPIGSSRRVFVVAGPCAVENEEQTLSTAHFVKKAGVAAFRAGAYKPRTSPYSFQGLGKKALDILRRVKEETGLLIVTELTSESKFEAVAEVADIIQIGAANMKNRELFRLVGRSKKPCLVKRGEIAEIDELLLAAEYIFDEGGGEGRVILCPRGLKLGERKYTRNMADVDAVQVLQEIGCLPVIFDPSHASGVASQVTKLARAAVAIGADGLIVEVHPSPRKALSDPAQQLDFEQFGQLMKEVRAVAQAIGKTI